MVTLLKESNKESDFVISKRGTLEDYTGKDSNVIIPDNVKRIDQSAFYGNTSLKSVTIPNGVTVEPYAFSRCTSLTNVTFQGTIKFGRERIEHDPETADFSNIFFKTPLKKIKVSGRVVDISSLSDKELNSLVTGKPIKQPSRKPSVPSKFNVYPNESDFFRKESFDPSNWDGTEIGKMISDYYGTDNLEELYLDFSWHPDEDEFEEIYGKSNVPFVKFVLEAVEKGKLIFETEYYNDYNLYEYKGFLVAFDEVEYFYLFQKK